MRSLELIQSEARLKQLQSALGATVNEYRSLTAKLTRLNTQKTNLERGRKLVLVKLSNARALCGSSPDWGVVETKFNNEIALLDNSMEDVSQDLSAVSEKYNALELRRNDIQRQIDELLPKIELLSQKDRNRIFMSRQKREQAAVLAAERKRLRQLNAPTG
jgi:hypothetical protein